MSDAGAELGTEGDEGKTGTSEQVAVEPPRRRWGKPLLRLLVLAAIIGGLITVAVQTGVTDELTREGVRSRVAEAGTWGPVVFIAVFALGQMIHVPGVVFVVAASVAWDAPLGAPLALVGAIVAVSANFFFVRTVGGQPVAQIRHPRFLAMLKRLDARPTFVVFILRVIFMTSPALTTALALTPIRFRHHLVGSALGMVPQVFAFSFFIDAFL